MRSSESGCIEPWKNIGGGTVLGDDRVQGGPGMLQGSPAKAVGVEETGGHHVYTAPPRGTEGAVCPGTSVSSPRASPQPGLPAVCVFQG